MADEIKPPLPGSTSPSPAPSGPSPLSPQIKIPSQPSTLTPPPGLPTRPMPSMPPSPQPAAVAPKPSAPPQPTPPPPPKPEIPAPPSPTGQPTFRSSIRTMQEDVEAIKKGQPLVGFQVEKPLEKEQKVVAPSPVGGPTITPPPPRPTQIELGRLEKARPMPGAPAVPAPSIKPITPPPVALKVPSAGRPSFNVRGLAVIAVVLVVAAAAIWFFLLRTPTTPVITYTPTPTAAPSIPIAPLIETAFSVASSVNLDVTGSDVFTKLSSTVNKDALATREPGLYKVFQSTQSGRQRYAFGNLMTLAGISVPQSVLSFVDDANSYLSLFLKTDNTYGYGILAKLNNQAGVDSALKGWETTLPSSLKSLFSINPTTAASSAFLDNTYQGLAVRYINFPDPNKTIDYAIITLSNGDKYLVITNSRDHMYSIIDKLAGI